MKYKNELLQRCAVCGKYIHLARHSYAKVTQRQQVQYVHLKVCYRIAYNSNHKLNTLEVKFRET